MIILLDLDGTLVHTADISYKPMKDGLEETDVSKIKPFPEAKSFVDELKKLGHTPFIISDSHPKYVNPVVQEYFGIPSLSLADKPNSKKTQDFLLSKGIDINNKDEIIVIGDTWLDIELGRSFGFKTILTQFYIAKVTEERDGIGRTWQHLKSGPTYVVKDFNKIHEILKNPTENLWAAEAFLIGASSINAIRLSDSNATGPYTIFRSLGRQEVGECDKFGIAPFYTEFQREDRSKENLRKLALSVQTYMKSVVESAPTMSWDYFTFVADKSTTMPPNKMRIFFELIDFGITNVELFKWNDDVGGSIRDRPNYAERRAFIAKNLNLESELDLNGKSVIVIDDQFTSGGTAYEVANKLRQKGVHNVLFITLFFMTSTVTSNKMCPKCGKPMQIKIRKSNGIKFFSCSPPLYRGNGCGYMESYN